MESEYTLNELTKEEADALTHDLQEVLKKHNCEMGVTSAINLMKRVEKGIPTPFNVNDEPNTTEEKKAD